MFGGIFHHHHRHKNLKEVYHSHIPKLKAEHFRGDGAQPTVDLRARMPPVYDQGAIGSCSANALCAAFAYDNPSVLGSRLFLYYNERKMEGDVSDDAGACLSDGVEALHSQGLCPETMWPYSDDKTRFKQQPPPECYQAARANEATAYHQVEPTEGAIKACLASGYPIVLGIKLFQSFEATEVASSGQVPMPRPGEPSVGGHAVCMCGYDDSRRVFVVRNSWGPSWGDKGYFYLPYAYLLGSPSYVHGDMWVITSVTNAPVPHAPTPIRAGGPPPMQSQQYGGGSGAYPPQQQQYGGGAYPPQQYNGAPGYPPQQQPYGQPPPQQAYGQAPQQQPPAGYYGGQGGYNGAPPPQQAYGGPPGGYGAPQGGGYGAPPQAYAGGYGAPPPVHHHHQPQAVYYEPPPREVVIVEERRDMWGREREEVVVIEQPRHHHRREEVVIVEERRDMWGREREEVIVIEQPRHHHHREEFF